MNEVERRFEYQSEDPLGPAKGIIHGIIAGVCLTGALVLIAWMCVGCGSMRPVVTENGGGGVVVNTTKSETPWYVPAFWVGGSVYLGSEVIKAIKGNDSSSSVYNYGTYNEVTGQNNSTGNTESTETAAHAKRMKSEAVTRRK